MGRQLYVLRSPTPLLQFHFSGSSLTFCPTGGGFNLFRLFWVMREDAKGHTGFGTPRPLPELDSQWKVIA